MTKSRKTVRLNKWILRFDRTFSDSIWRQIGILLAFFLLTLLIGLVVCAFLPFGKDGSRLAFYEWALYLFIDGNALSNLYMDEYPDGNRLWVLLFGIIGSILGVVIFSGMLISVLSNMLERRIENYRQGRHVYVKSGHHLILGYDEIVPAIIKQICTADEEAYILLQSSTPSEEVDVRLRASIAQDCLERVIIKSGHRTSTENLSSLKLAESREVYIVGDRQKASHDAENIECIAKISEILKGSTEHPDIIMAVFEDQDTFAAMQVADLFEDIRNLGIEFIPYNFYASWARQLFVDYQYTDNGVTYTYPAIDGTGISDTDSRHIHLVIIGTSTFGLTLGVEAAKILHFPNFEKGKNLTRITFVDPDADRERNLFTMRYRHFFEVQSHKYCGKPVPATKFKGGQADFLDIEFEFIKDSVSSPTFQHALTEWAGDETQMLSLVIAMKDSRENLSVAMNLPDEIYEKAISVFVHQPTSSKFLTQLHTKSERQMHKIAVVDNCIQKTVVSGRYANIYPFGMTDIILDVNKRAQRIAECIHHLYTVCEALAWKRMPTLAEVSDVSWEKIHQEWISLSPALQWSNLYCAYNIQYRLHSLQAMREAGSDDIQADAKEAEILGRVEHNRWNVEKLLLGYRKPSEEEDYYAERNRIDCQKIKMMKDTHKKLYIHCDIRPYNELDKIQEIDKRIIDYIPWFLNMSKTN